MYWDWRRFSTTRNGETGGHLVWRPVGYFMTGSEKPWVTIALYSKITTSRTTIYERTKMCRFSDVTFTNVNDIEVYIWFSFLVRMLVCIRFCSLPFFEKMTHCFIRARYTLLTGMTWKSFLVLSKRHFVARMVIHLVIYTVIIDRRSLHVSAYKITSGFFWGPSYSSNNFIL